MDETAALVRAYLDGARTGLAPNLYIEGEVLTVNGWWQAAFRLDEGAYIIRAEAPPSPTDVMDALASGLTERGLAPVPGEHPLVQAVTYAELSVTGVEWTLWAVNAEHGEQALARRAAPEVAPQAAAPGGPAWAPGISDDPAMGDLSAEFARSFVEGMPASVVLAVGLDDEVVAGLEAAVPDCRVQTTDFEDAVAVCGVTVPHLVIVEASRDHGRRFLLEFRAEACGRHVPVAAVTDADQLPGADVTLDPYVSPAGWQEQLERLLP